MSGTIRRILAVPFLVALFPMQTSATRLADGTRIRVRLLSVITSETSTRGDPVAFVVIRDVIRDGEVVIGRGSRVTGAIVDATPMNLGWVTHPGRLAFRFDAIAWRDGRAVRLRASAAPRASDRVTVDRSGRHHWLQWADGADTFDAFVDGDYDLSEATVNRHPDEHSKTGAPLLTTLKRLSALTRSRTRSSGSCPVANICHGMPLLNDKENAREACSISDARSSTLRSSWRNRKERFDEIPQRIRKQRGAYSGSRYSPMRDRLLRTVARTGCYTL